MDFKKLLIKLNKIYICLNQYFFDQQLKIKIIKK